MTDNPQIPPQDPMWTSPDAALAGVPESPTVLSGQHFSAHNPPAGAWRNMHVTDCQFSGLTLQVWQLEGVRFERCQFTDVRVNGGSFRHCDLFQCRLNNVSLHQLEVSHLYSHQSQWENLQLTQSRLSHVTLQQDSGQLLCAEQCHTAHWTLIEVTLSQLRLLNGQAQDWNFSDCTLEQGHFQALALVRWVAASSRFAHCRFSLLPGRGPVWFKCQLEACVLQQQTLPGISFHQSRLTGCDLSASDFSGGIFSAACLTDCLLNDTELQAVQGADLQLAQCQLRGARLTAAHLQRAALSHCALATSEWTRADLRDACLDRPDAAELATARLYGSHLPEGEPARPADPLLQAIERWYAQFQPGPHAGLSFPTLPSGVSRYV
ncbi:pentapeptide repeat-containing protein [Erwinia sp. Leaf53]|uniref:pentapeptide repeat-containing protein n=1 Tax=Erwinia sp. Leaf53 TaxID=1736225 RepID=UPI0006F4291B|nr:pentapeptide repeat-containing protein [Erwinia sp. Leaf53]KQN53236.1 hypothetical protein ASF13_16705 [Erwinia sp. Leaf53]